jgi:hypothetical protein
MNTQTINIKSRIHNSIAIFSLNPYTLAGFEPGSVVPGGGCDVQQKSTFVFQKNDSFGPNFQQNVFVKMRKKWDGDATSIRLDDTFGSTFAGFFKDNKLAWLPDGIIPYQNSKFGTILVGLWVEYVLYSRWVFLWTIGIFFGHFVYFLRFDVLQKS